MITNEQMIDLIPHETLVVDSEGTKYLFLGFDEDNDLIVEWKGSHRGWIVLYREKCSLSEGV